MATVISHFFNEERMLRWWLPHHLALFDDGILIDHNSTDGSCDVIRELAPNWTIVKTELRDFSAIDNDFEVMCYEKKISGWKMVLNVSEFLIFKNFKEKLNNYEHDGVRCIRTNGVVMVDKEPFIRADTSTSILKQKYCGYIEREYLEENLFREIRKKIFKRYKNKRIKSKMIEYRSRIIHNYSTGAYLPGRHETLRYIDVQPNDIFTLWYGYSPWDDEFISRKMSFGSRIPKDDIIRGMGTMHLRNRSKLQLDYEKLIKNASYLDFIRDFDPEFEL